VVKTVSGETYNKQAVGFELRVAVDTGDCMPSFDMLIAAF